MPERKLTDEQVIDLLTPYLNRPRPGWKILAKALGMSIQGTQGRITSLVTKGKLQISPETIKAGTHTPA
jgi:hypothetical protein